MKTTIYASSEERAIFLLYEHLGQMVLIKDKDGKPVKWITKYPPLQHLIKSCKEMKVSLPKSPSMKAVLLAMCRSKHTDLMRYPAKVESLTERALHRELEKLPRAPATKKGATKKDVSKPIDQKEAAINKMEAEQSDRETDKKTTLKKGEIIPPEEY